MYENELENKKKRNKKENWVRRDARKQKEY